MSSKPSIIEENKPVGVIGSGSFGIAIAKLLSINTKVYIFARRAETKKAIEERTGRYTVFPENVYTVNSLEELAQKCQIIFPIIPSKAFRQLMQQLGPLLNPEHFLIHGIKGLDLSLSIPGDEIQAKHIKTMSEVIEEESVVCRIGCLSGPNLSAELIQGQPAATVVASKYTEVIKEVQKVLRSDRFQVYGTHDIIGAELAGALKNIIALAAGMLDGKGLGKNIWALLITRGLSEMIHIGKAVGADVKAFLGVAGIGDLVATASSSKSRNYKAGIRIAKGETLEQIQGDTTDVIEGIRTLATAKALVSHLNIQAPIISILYKVIFKDLDLDKGIHFLMAYPYAVDVDYL